MMIHQWNHSALFSFMPIYIVFALHVSKNKLISIRSTLQTLRINSSSYTLFMFTPSYCHFVFTFIISFISPKEMLIIPRFLEKHAVFHLTKFVVRFRKYRDNITYCHAKSEQCAITPSFSRSAKSVFGSLAYSVPLLSIISIDGS